MTTLLGIIQGNRGTIGERDDIAPAGQGDYSLKGPILITEEHDI